MEISSSTNLLVVTQSQDTCLLADTDETSESPLPWRTKLKEKRANKKWQSKLNGLQAQMAKSRENLFLLEATLQNDAATETAVQSDIKPWACLSDWGQEDAIPLPQHGAQNTTLQ